MATTKKRTSRKRADTRAALAARATSIINSPINEHDADTREAVRVALSNFNFFLSSKDELGEVKAAEADLREAVRCAEAGEPAFDIDEIGEKYVNAARMVYAILEESGVPEFIYGSVMTALDEAARLTGGALWIDTPETTSFDAGGYSIARMARLFKSNAGLRLELVPKPDLAQMLSAVCADPDLPTDILDGIRYGMNDAFNDLKTEHQNNVECSVGYLRALFENCAEQEAEQD